MGPQSGAGCRGDWHSVSDFGSESHSDPFSPRHEEPSKQANNPCGEVQQTPKKINPRKVHPEPSPRAKNWNENGDAQEVHPIHGSRRPQDEAAQRTSESSSAREHESNTDVPDNHVNHGQRIAHYGSCKLDFLEHWNSCVKVLEELDNLLRKILRFMRFFDDAWELPFSFFVKRNGGREKATGKRGSESRPGDVRERLLGRLPVKELTQPQAVSKGCKDLAKTASSPRSRGLSGENAVTALNFITQRGNWQCTGFDLGTGKWRRLPALACLPSPDLELFQQFSICGHGGLMCANVSKSTHKEELVVFNISTGERKELPPLKLPRNPVLLHIWVDSDTDSYKVVAAGSASGSGEKDLSRRIEVYDSRTSEWETMIDISGPEFGLNEHQVGGCVDGVLYFIMFLDGDEGQKGIVAFDIKEGKWLEDKTCALPFSSFCNTLQLLENCGKLYLFSERERDGVLEHFIDVLELLEDSDTGEEFWQLRTVVRVTKSGGRGLLVYPEFICVPFGIGKLCVFNTISREGMIYDLDNGKQSGVLEAPSENQNGEKFFCLNPVSFTLALNSTSKP